ncbi:DNA-binding protein [Streptomyces decoyicus]|uniref:DNA-binding protein n=1 Tax=Streptomyces decoyicus TaxID=249567 RepID=UPI00365BA019
MLRASNDPAAQDPWRPVTTEAEVAQRAGMPLTTWQRRCAPRFRALAPELFDVEDARGLARVYDLAQAEAAQGEVEAALAEGRETAPSKIDALPGAQHPEDRLNAREAGDLLGIDADEVYALAARGYLPKGEKVRTAQGKTIGRLTVWSRRALAERMDNAPGQGVGGGRKPGPQPERRKARPYQGDPRLKTAAEAVATAPDTPTNRIAVALAETHGGSTRTWERILAAASDATPHDSPA